MAFASPTIAASIAPVALPLTEVVAIGLHFKDGCAKKASDKAQKAIIKALQGQPEFTPEVLTRATSLLKDADTVLTLSPEMLLAAAKSGNFEAEVVQHLLAPLPLDTGESAVRQILKSALRAGLTACRQDESFHQALTQELLIEAARVNDVQLDLLGEIKSDTTEIRAELKQQSELMKQLLAGKIPEGLTLEQLHALAAQFKVVVNEGDTPQAIFQNLTLRAQEIEALEQRLADMQSQFPQLGNAIAQARAKLEQGDTQAVRKMVSDARVVLRDAKLLEALEQDAQLVEIDARALLIEGNLQEAFTILSAAADSFASLDPLLPSQKRNAYFPILYDHGLRYGGTALGHAISLLQSALGPLSAENADTLWAGIQNNLANALDEQANRTEGAAGTALLADAISAYRAALSVYTEIEHPMQWSSTHKNLAVSLRHQANRTEDEVGVDLLAKAVDAYYTSLSLRTKTEHPEMWASTQNNLANALADQANRTEGAAVANLLAEAVSAYRAALSVRTKTEHPVDWAMTQNNLANALANQANRNKCAAGDSLLAKAVDAYNAALSVRTKAEHPVDWATTTNNLAAALANQANRTEGAAGADLLAEAVSAFRAALSVYTKAEHPVQWAITKENLALLEVDRAQHDSCENPHPHLEAALAYVEEALTVYDPVHMAPDYATASDLRARLLKALNTDD